MTIYYSERLQSVSFNMRRLENDEELIDKAININNEWITALSVFIAELSHIKILINVQHHRSDAKQLRHYSTIN